MSDRTDPQPVEQALRGLADAIATGAAPPAAAGLRAWATRRQRVRRTATAVLAAAAVAALAIGGVQVIDLAAGPPAPPAGTPTATASPAAPPPTATPSATASPQPPPVPAVTPSPRPAPLEPQAPPDDPITRVDWFDAAVTLPDSEYCPAGRVQFAPFDSGAGPPRNARVHADGKVIDVLPDSASVAYGDVTGDGRIEVVLAVECFLSSTGTDFGSGHGGWLLAVARADDGTLTGLGFLGPRSADIQEVWVADGRVLMVGDPWTANPDDHFPGLPGLVLSYRWDGSRFVGWEPAADFPPIVPLDPSGIGPPAGPRAVAAGLGCPDVELRFSRTDAEWGGTATAGDATFVIPSKIFQQHLFDLDNTGRRLLVTALACTGSDGWTREGLAVFERAGDGWQGISVLTPPPGLDLIDAGGWGTDLDGGFYVSWARPSGEGEWEADEIEYRWTGTVFEAVE